MIIIFGVRFADVASQLFLDYVLSQSIRVTCSAMQAKRVAFTGHVKSSGGLLNLTKYVVALQH